jgi:spermidine/putrescine transport system permease protein
MRKALGAVTAVLLLVLYAPIVVMAVFSFNDSKKAEWKGFTTHWYRKMWDHRELRVAVENTAIIAVGAAVLSTVLGTMAALAARHPFRGKRLYAALLALPITIPDIVLAFAMMALFLAAGVELSIWTAMIAHSTYGMAYVAVVVSARLQGLDRTLELAAQDLGATPVQAFWKVTFPAILPAVISGALLSFTLSFDDFVVTYFTSGSGNATLPVKIYSMVRFQVTPEINAVSTVILAVSLVLIAASLRISRVPAAGGGR